MKSFPQNQGQGKINPVSKPQLQKPTLNRATPSSSPQSSSNNPALGLHKPQGQVKNLEGNQLNRPKTLQNTFNKPKRPQSMQERDANQDSQERKSFQTPPKFSPLKPDETKQSIKKPVPSFTLSKEPYLADNSLHQDSVVEEEKVQEVKQDRDRRGPVRNRDLNRKKQETVQKQEKINQKPQHLMSVTDFYCTHHELIKEIVDKVLTMKFGSKVAKGTEDLDTRYQIENEAAEDVRNYLESKNIPGLDYSKMPEYVHIIFAEAMGYGILEFLLNDKEVDEIMVQTHDHIYAEKHGVPVLTEYKFPSFDVAKGIVNRIIRPLNKTLDVSNPNVDAQLPDGSRLSASIPPLRAEGEISIDIRKFSDRVYPLSHYSEKYKSSTPEMVQFAEACVKAKKTTIVSGGTGSGKTTILNALTYALGQNERILVIEDTREIRCQVPHTEYYLRVPGNKEGYEGISISDIIQMSLRKRPDRIFVGECRGGEFNEYLNAANTGHDGSMTSIHANSPAELFPRMENMLYKNDETKNMTHEAIMRVLASSVDIIIQTKRLEDGSRRITNITEVLGYGKEGFDKLKKMRLVKDSDTFDPYKIYMRDIFYFREIDVETTEEDGIKKKHVKGEFVCSGYIPFCNKALKKAGVGFDNSFFEKRVLMEV